MLGPASYRLDGVSISDPFAGSFGQDILVLEGGGTDSDSDGNPNVRVARETGLSPESAGGFVNMAQKLASHAHADTVMTFQVPGTVSLDPDGQPRRVAVSRATLPAQREYLVIPSARTEAFLLVRVEAPGDRPLLAGAVKHYIGPTLVGSSTMLAVAPGEEFVLSFGVDERVKVESWALPYTTDERGNDRMVSYARRAAITNRTGRPIAVKAKERVPVATHDDIRVHVGSTTTAGFKEIQTEPGIYTWDLSLVPDERKEISLAYSVRYPAGMSLAVGHR